MRRAVALLLLLAWLAAPSTSAALTLHFEPAASELALGSSLEVAVVASELVDGAAPSLGSFDFEVLFDAAILSLTSVSFGDQLDLAGAGSLTGVDDTTPGSVSLFEVSYDSAADLDELQAASFTLVTLTFEALAQGSSPLEIVAASAIFGDSLGDPLVATFAAGAVNVDVPEPRVLALLALAAVALLARRARAP